MGNTIKRSKVTKSTPYPTKQHGNKKAALVHDVEASVRAQISQYLSQGLTSPSELKVGKPVTQKGKVPKQIPESASVSLLREEVNVKKELLDLLGLFYLNHDFVRLVHDELDLVKLAEWTLVNGMDGLNARLLNRFGEDLRDFAARTRIRQVGVEMVSVKWDNVKLRLQEEAASARNEQSRLALEKLDKQLGFKDESINEPTAGLDTIVLMSLMDSSNYNPDEMDGINLQESGSANSAWAIDSMRLELEAFFIYADPWGLRKDAFRTLMSYGINIGRRELERVLFFQYRKHLNFGQGPLILSAETVDRHRVLVAALLNAFFSFITSKIEVSEKQKRNGKQGKVNLGNDENGTNQFKDAVNLVKTDAEINSLVNFAIDTGLAKLNSKFQTKYKFDLTDFMLSSSSKYRSKIPREPKSNTSLPQEQGGQREEGNVESRWQQVPRNKTRKQKKVRKGRKPTPHGTIKGRTPTPHGTIKGRTPTPHGTIKGRTPTPHDTTKRRIATPHGTTKGRAPTPLGTMNNRQTQNAVGTLRKPIVKRHEVDFKFRNQTGQVPSL